MRGMTPLSKVKESLESLTAKSIFGPIIDISFTSTIRMFHNLVFLNVQVHCHGSEGRCTFKLNNDNVAELAMALRRLRSLLLGRACPDNTCATTVACLLPISVYCLDLRELEIHFNTTNIVEDFKNISEDPRLQELRSLPKSTLICLDVWKTPLLNESRSLETVVDGMFDIFPSLQSCNGFKGSCDALNEKIAESGRRCVSPDTREQADDGKDNGWWY